MSLIIQGVSKTYPNGVQALKNIGLEIPSGMFGLLGPNGAGKSSLMRTVATLQEPDQGRIFFHGRDILKDKDGLRRQLGYLPQEFDVYPKTSAEELLDYLAQLKGVSNSKERKELVAQLLTLTNLYEYRKKAVATYSGGMKQRFGIAQALIAKPKLIIVDEPTAGLDPEERVRFHNLLADIDHDATVILSTHIVADVADLCQNFAIVDQGQLIVQTSPAEALAALAGKIWEQRSSKQKAASDGKLISTRLSRGDHVHRFYSENMSGQGAEPVAPALEDYYFIAIKGMTL